MEQGAPSTSSPYLPLSQGEGIGSYARKVAEAGLGPLPDPKLVIPNHPEVRGMTWWNTLPGNDWYLWLIPRTCMGLCY